MRSFEEFVRRAITVDEEKTEPFCPFSTCGYCSVAYSDQCYQCMYAREAYQHPEES